MPKLTVIKEAGDLESSALTQRAVAAYLDGGHLPAHLARLQRVSSAPRHDAGGHGALFSAGHHLDSPACRDVHLGDTAGAR